MTLLSVISFVYLSYLTNFCQLLGLSPCACLYIVHFAFEKDPARFEIKANNYYFAFILKV